jgi:anti-sigma factor RsiW
MRRDDDLLAAYLDGVSELTADERRAVEARLADDGALRDEADATRALLGELRELPPETDAPGGAPDWAALERSILGAVGPEVPRPWWRRFGFRWALPAVALVAAAAILALVVRAPDRATAPAPGLARPGSGTEQAPGVAPGSPVPPGEAPAPAPAPAEETVALWLDGEDVEVALDAEALLEVPWERDAGGPGMPGPGPGPEMDLLPASDLAWVDELAAEELARAEALLKDPELRQPVRRKRS